MSHPFGDLLTQYRAHKTGMSQNPRAQVYRRATNLDLVDTQCAVQQPLARRSTCSVIRAKVD